MSYVIESLRGLGTLGVVGSDARALIADAAPAAIPLKMKLSDNVKAQPSLTRYQHFNLIRFNKAIKNSSDPEITSRMSKGDYDQFYKDWRAMIRNPLKKLRSGSPGEKAQKDDKRPKWSNGELNALLYDEFKKWYNEVKPAAPRTEAPPGAGAPPADNDGNRGESGDNADAENATDNTMLYVGLGVGVVLLALAATSAKKPA